MVEIQPSDVLSAMYAIRNCAFHHGFSDFAKINHIIYVTLSHVICDILCMSRFVSASNKIFDFFQNQLEFIHCCVHIKLNTRVKNKNAALSLYIYTSNVNSICPGMKYHSWMNALKM